MMDSYLAKEEGLPLVLDSCNKRDKTTELDDYSDSGDCSSTETLKPAPCEESAVVNLFYGGDIEYPRNRVKSVEDGYFSHESDFAKTKPARTPRSLKQPIENIDFVAEESQLSRVRSNLSIVSVDMSTCHTTTSARSPAPHEFVASGSLQTLGGKSFSSGEILGSRSSLNKKSFKGRFSL